MSELFDTVKRKIGQIVVSCPKYLKMTIPALLRDYASVHDHDIPFKKFNHRDVLSLLREMDDMIEIKEDRDTGGLYLEYRRGYNAIMDEKRSIILKDKIPSEAKKQIKRNIRELQESSSSRYAFSAPCIKERPMAAPETPQFSPPPEFIERILNIINNSEETWAFNLPEIYRKAYGVELPLQMYRYEDPGSLAEYLESQGLVRLERSRLHKNHRIFPTKTKPLIPKVSTQLNSIQKEVGKELEQILTQVSFCVPLKNVSKLHAKLYPSRNLGEIFRSYAEFKYFLQQNRFSIMDVSGNEFLFAPVDNDMPPIATKAPKQLYLDADDRDDLTAMMMNIKSLSCIYVMWEEEGRRFQISSAELGNCLENPQLNNQWAFTPRSLFDGQLLAVRSINGLWERVVVSSVNTFSLLCQSLDIGTEIELSLPLEPYSVQLLPEAFSTEPICSRIVSIQCLPQLLQKREQLAVSCLNELLDESRHVLVIPSSDPNARITDKTATLVGLQIFNKESNCYHDLRATLVEMVQNRC